ncbi:hypothetical protein LBMAG52_36660 [Planctomycetia bacterium]|nr:hypothetical protein LBMAG52_36660 [Planctomycetia bacterium]
MAFGGMAKKLRNRHGRKIEIDGETYYVRSPIMRELRQVDELRVSQKNGTPEQQDEVSRLATAAWFAFVICEDADGTLTYSRDEGESLIDWATRVEEELSNVENATMQAISSKVGKITAQPTVEAVVKN